MEIQGYNLQPLQSNDLAVNNLPALFRTCAELEKVGDTLCRAPSRPNGIVIKIDDASTSVAKAGCHIVKAYRDILTPFFQGHKRGEVGLIEMRINSEVTLLHPGVIDIVDSHQPQATEYMRKSLGGILSTGSPLADAFWIMSELAQRLRRQGFTGPIACMLTADGGNNHTLDPALNVRESEERAKLSLERARRLGTKFQLLGFIPKNEKPDLDRFVNALGLVFEPAKPEINEVEIHYYERFNDLDASRSVTSTAHSAVDFMTRTIDSRI